MSNGHGGHGGGADHGAHESHEGGGFAKKMAEYAEYLNPFKIAFALRKLGDREGVKKFLEHFGEFAIGMSEGIAMMIPGLFGIEGGHGGGHKPSGGDKAHH